MNAMPASFINYVVVSAFPGRVRVQLTHGRGYSGVPLPAARGNTLLETFAQRLRGVEGVQTVQTVLDASSVVVRYAPGIWHLDALLVQVHQVAERVFLVPPLHSLPLPASALQETSRRRERSDRRTAGRICLRLPLLHQRHGVAALIRTALLAKRGIHHVKVAPDAGTLIVRYDPDKHRPQGLMARVRHLLHTGLTPASRPTGLARARDIGAEADEGFRPLLFPTLALTLSLLEAAPALVVGALTLAGLPTLRRALVGIRMRRPNVDQLDFVALVMLAGLGDFFTGGLMTWLIGLGDVIQNKTMRRSHQAISELMAPSASNAWVERDGSLVSMSLDRLQAEDVVVVHPGDQIPVDGIITQGHILVDLKLLTGKSAPVLRREGDQAYALTTVVDGQAHIRVQHIGSETRAGRVAAMIEEAPLSDTRIANYAAKIGDRLVLPIFALAGASYLVTGSLIRMASILILDFATGIRVSAPTTVLSAMTGAARQGLFIKGGKAMEQLAVVDAFVFDKTGTLTQGCPVVTAVCALDNALTSDEVLCLAAGAEAKLKHPAANAIVRAAQERGLGIPPIEEMENVLGLGVKAVIGGRVIQVGSERYMRQLAIEMNAMEEVAAPDKPNAVEGNSVVFVAREGCLIGLITYTDPPRAESEAVIQALRERGVRRIVMLTGDNARTAHSVAGRLGITDVIADAFPEQKADVIQQLCAEGYTVAVIGDGVNDAPAFAYADVSVSLPRGADVAKETADIILLDDDLWGLPRAIDLSRRALGILQQNLNIIVAPTALGLVASVAGFASPIVSTLINNGTTVLAGLNALRPLWAGSNSKDARARAVRLIASGENPL